MTKTFSPVDTHGVIDPGLRLMIRLRKIFKGFKFEILNFGHLDLFEIWILVLGIFLMFIKQVIFIKYVNPHDSTLAKQN